MFTNVSRPSAVDVLRPFVVGDLFQADSTSTLARLPDVAVGNVLLSGGVGALAAYGKVDVVSHVTGVLPAINGGTGVANNGTITNASNTTITGGGTLALAGFTLTVPATGTAMLLSETQTVSGAKTFTSAQGIVVSGIPATTNAILVLNGATATNSILRFQTNSVDTGDVFIGGTGNWTFRDLVNSTTTLTYTAGAIGAGYWSFANTTDSTSKDTGSIVTEGGIGAEKAITAGTSIKSVSPTAGIGYATGAGGTVVQGSGSGKATTVTLNTVCGTITMDGANLNADTSVAFTFTNSAIAATDYVAIQHNSVGTLGGYVCVCTPGAGTATVTVRNVTPGNLAEAIVLRFVVIKAVTS